MMTANVNISSWRSSAAARFHCSVIEIEIEKSDELTSCPSVESLAVLGLRSPERRRQLLLFNLEYAVPFMQPGYQAQADREELNGTESQRG